MDAIFSRRSIRKFTSQPVTEAQITLILSAAMAAPSAGNEQPWHFVVLTERSLMDAVPKFHPHSSMIKEATCAILVCGDLSLETHKGYWMIDCAAATENLLLAVQALGLGAVWLGIYPRPERMDGMKKLLDLPAPIVPFALIPVGYPGEKKEPLDRYDASRIHYNRW